MSAPSEVEVISHLPDIAIRDIRPSDKEVLKRLHDEFFPVKFDDDFFDNVVRNGSGMASWGVVDSNRPDGKTDQLIGFVTTQLHTATSSEVGDLIKSESKPPNPSVLYISSIGVIEPYTKHGIARSLMGVVTNYASSIPTCEAVYLHVFTSNEPAIVLYQKMSFKKERMLPSYYKNMEGKDYDAYLFVYYVKRGCCSSCAIL